MLSTLPFILPLSHIENPLTFMVTADKNYTVFLITMHRLKACLYNCKNYDDRWQLIKLNIHSVFTESSHF